MILYIMVGPAGAGKTTFASKYLHHNGVYHISRDVIRYLLVKDEDDYFSKEKQVFREFVKAIKLTFTFEDCEAVIADATHLNWGSRRKLLAALGVLDGQYPDLAIIPVVVRPNADENLRRNAERNGRARVPSDVVMRMYNSMTSPWGDPFKYTAVMEVKE